MRSDAKSYMRKGFLIYEEIRKYLTIYEEAVSHCNCSFLTLHILYMRKILFQFLSAYGTVHMFLSLHQYFQFFSFNSFQSLLFGTEQFQMSFVRPHAVFQLTFNVMLLHHKTDQLLTIKRWESELSGNIMFYVTREELVGFPDFM